MGRGHELPTLDSHSQASHFLGTPFPVRCMEAHGTQVRWGSLVEGAADQATTHSSPSSPPRTAGLSVPSLTGPLL